MTHTRSCPYCADLRTARPQAALRSCSPPPQLDHRTVTGQLKPAAGASARVYLHPRVVEGPAHGALQAHLEERGFDLERLRVGPPGRKGFMELVWFVSETENKLTLQRLDGVRFDHPVQRQTTGSPTTPEVA